MMQPIPNKEVTLSILQGVFWGKPLQASASWQQIAYEIDHWVLGQEGIGLLGNHLFLAEFEGLDKRTVCMRRLWGPKKSFEAQVQNNVDGWEAYVVKMDKDIMQAKLFYCSWVWSKKMPFQWEGPLNGAFCKL